MGTPLQEGAQQPPAAGSGAMSADEQREVARSIGLGGIKYAPGQKSPRPLQTASAVTDEPVRYR